MATITEAPSWTANPPAINSTSGNLTTEATVGFVFADTPQRTAVACLFCIIGGIGLIGNSLVIIAVAISQRLQTPTNVFVVSLSLSDLLTCLGLPFQAVAVLSDDGWPLPTALCALVGGSAIMSLTCSVLGLAIIALNRFTLITRSKRTYSMVFSTKRNIVYAVVTWLYPLFLFVVPQLAGFGRLGYDATFKLCAWDTYHPAANVYEILAAITIFVSTSIITASYITIYIFIRRHVAVMQNHANQGGNQAGPSVKTNQVVDMSVLNQVVDGGMNQSYVTQNTEELRAPFDNKRRVSRKDIDITINLFYIVCIFFLCIIPYGIALALTDSGAYPVYAGLLFVMNSAINPFIYASKHPNFREVFKCMCTCNFSAILEPSPWLRSLIG